MYEPGTPSPTPAEIEAGREALRELGHGGPVPGDVLARLDARLEGELGPATPARRAGRKRRFRLALVAPGFGVALAAVVAVVVISTSGGSSPRPDAAAPTSALEKSQALVPQRSATPAVPATAGTSGAHDSGAIVAAVRVPSVVGRTYPEARTLLRARGLVPDQTGVGCPASVHITRQKPVAGTRALRGSTVVLVSNCLTFTSP